MSCHCCFSGYENDGSLQAKLEYDPTFDGVEVDNRRCTDVFCCLVFFAFIIGLFVILFFTIPKSNPAYLLIPTDHRGLLCGYNNHLLKIDNSQVPSGLSNLSDLNDLTDKPQLFWVRPGKPGYSRSFCVKECPKEGTLLQAINNSATLSSRNYAGQPSGTSCGNFTNFTTSQTWIVNVSIENYSTTDSDRYFCPFASQQILHRCFPNQASVQELVKAGAEAKDTLDGLIGNFTGTMEAASWAGNAVQDVYGVLWVIGLCTIIALVLSLVWLFLLRICACFLVWVTVILSIAALGGLTYICWGQAHNQFGNYEQIEGYTFGFVSQDLNREVFSVFFYILAVLDVIFFLLLIFLIPRIKMSIKVIELVASMFGKVPSLFLLPIAIFVFMIIWWVAIIAIGCVLFGAGTPTRVIAPTIEGDNLTVVDRIDMKYDKTLQGMAIYDFVAFLWGTLFFVALSEITVAGVVAAWFFTRPDERGSGLWCSGLVTKTLLRSLRYHIGSLAFGSAIITVCKVIRAAFEYVDQKTKNSQSQVAKFVIKCMKCCLWCLEKFLKFLNRNVYIIIAIHGNSFCPAAAKAFGLILRNAARVATLNWVGDFTLFLGRVFVAGGVTIVGIYLFPVAKPDVQCIVVPAVLVFVCGWLASAAFTGVFEMGIDAMFICYLEDEERNDGTPGRARYASEELQQYVKSGTSNEALMTPIHGER